MFATSKPGSFEVSEVGRDIISSSILVACVLAARPGRNLIEEIARTIAINSAKIVRSLRMSRVLQMNCIRPWGRSQGIGSCEGNRASLSHTFNPLDFLSQDRNRLKKITHDSIVGNI